MSGNYGFYCLLLICSLQQAMGNQYREVWRPDPHQHLQGITYEKLQEVFQVYPVTRKYTDQAFDLFGTCKGLSGFNREVKHLTPDKTARLVKPCRSILQNCQNIPFMQTNKGLRMCVSSDKSRRYDYAMQVSRVNPTEEFGRYDRSCNLYEQFNNYGTYYICTCDCESSEQDVDRYFSLLDVVADEHKVVTGVRMKKDNNVFHIQIQQGTLGANLTIVGEAQWKDIQSIPTSDLLSNNISEWSGEYRASEGQDDLLQFHNNNLVYAVTSERNTVLLDDVQAGPGNVVTGLRFRQIDDDLRLEVRATPYFQKTGDLQPLASQWKHNEVARKQRQPVTFESPDDPAWHKGTDVISSKDKYVQFRTSDFYKDLGQSTVPFIDIQDVVAEPPSPLLAVGIFHKGNKNSAGFIAFKGLY